ncbi:hypothetical protein A9P82_12055 [Arachidicoccus ginsenosidimutans]|uniref:cupin domain-containing protein n=1 Tax=Arachidicoccus sp. BS20 TaxID=1850526 RepID=UPI0007F0CA34|nr:cupin domain-containing protein [Arachidicoccus sp. BS20]ANI89956.1 hypothetical protein A9P82_12055 [Arachidicoccus sp. BS20]
MKIIQSAGNTAQSIIEFDILPGEKTPWHYHTLFSETFQIIEGSLQVGKNDKIMVLQENESITIHPKEKHFFHNISSNPCHIIVTVNPGSINFEMALFISKGLYKDGLASASGTPKRLKDLALFVFLNNSQMVGSQKMAIPLFNYLVKKNIRNGYLDELKHRYVNNL